MSDIVLIINWSTKKNLSDWPMNKSFNSFIQLIDPLWNQF